MAAMIMAASSSVLAEMLHHQPVLHIQHGAANPSVLYRQAGAQRGCPGTDCKGNSSLSSEVFALLYGRNSSISARTLELAAMIIAAIPMIAPGQPRCAPA